MSEISTLGATSAYRGYRLQTLYTLSRLLGIDDLGLIFQPEGTEDIAILSRDTLSLVEVVQVKALSHSLTLTSFKPEKADSFFYRAARMVSSSPEVKIRVVTFGQIGSELSKAIATNGPQRATVARKLASYGLISQSQAYRTLSRIELTRANEKDMTDSVLARLSGMLTGVDAKNAFDLLNFWLYVRAENKGVITQTELVEKLNNVGRYLAERAVHHKEWFTSIVPIEDRPISQAELQRLAAEFHSGTAARYQHILANLDVARPEKTTEIQDAFRRVRVAIIHGASGQGKSSLAYRYLNQFFPEHWRFRVVLIQDRRHALNIASALGSHARAIGVPVVVYLDVSPSDTSWADLVRELHATPEILILVTIREEDFRRTNVSGSEFAFSTIELGLDVDEARKVFGSLSETTSPRRFIDFEDAWNAFGAGGPLLEFTHLVTQGESLSARLREQVARLSDEVRTAKMDPREMELLRLVSVAGAFEVRLSLVTLAQRLGLPAPARTVELLEKEYLLRTSEDGALVVGLHPIRSSILSDLLSDPSLSPWVDSATACLPAIYEPDLESFLLHCFSRKKSLAGPVLRAISKLKPTTWQGASGVFRALLWLGLADYAEENRDVLNEAVKHFGSGWWLVLDVDICSVYPAAKDLIWELFASSAASDRLEPVRQMRARQSSKDRVFEGAKEWITNLKQTPAMPTSDQEWSCLAEVLFWAGYLKCSWKLPDWLDNESLLAAARILPLEILADLVLAVDTMAKARGTLWESDILSEVLRIRFREETRTALLEDRGGEFFAHFIVGADGVSNSTRRLVKPASGSDLHAEAEMRLRLMRELFPDAVSYGCQGYGHQILAEPLPTDETYKSKVSKESLPPRWLTFTNSVFRGLVERGYQPQTWTDFSRAVVELRVLALDAIELLMAGVNAYFRKREPTDLTYVANAATWSRCQHVLSGIAPGLPSSVIDEWGFAEAPKWSSGQMVQAQTNETGNGSPEAVSSRRTSWAGRSLALQRYERLSTSVSAYFQSLVNFTIQVPQVSLLNPLLGRRARSKDERREILERAQAAGMRPDFGGLSLGNLIEAIKNLSHLQHEFADKCEGLTNRRDLEMPQDRERHVCSESWPVWHFFVHHPEQVMHKPLEYCAGQAASKLKSIKHDVRRRLRPLESEEIKLTVDIRGDYWECEPNLLITANARSPLLISAAFESIVNEVRQGIQKIWQTSLGRHVIELYCPNLIILPLVRGRSLTRTLWKLYLPALLTEALPTRVAWWNRVEKPVSDRDLANLKTQAWDDPLLKTAASFAQDASASQRSAAHILSVASIPTADSRGEETTSSYIASVVERQREVTRSLLLAGQQMLAILKTAHPPSDGKSSEFPLAAAAILKTLQLAAAWLESASHVNGHAHKAALVAFVEQYNASLKQASESALLSYFLFSTIALDRLGIEWPAGS
jgi:hypothetical protein